MALTDPTSLMAISTGLNTLAGLFSGGMSKEEKALLMERLKNMWFQSSLAKESAGKLAGLESQMTAPTSVAEMSNMGSILRRAAMPGLNKFASAASSRLGSRSGATYGAIGNQMGQSIYQPMADFYANMENIRKNNIGRIYGARVGLASL